MKCVIVCLVAMLCGCTPEPDGITKLKQACFKAGAVSMAAAIRENPDVANRTSEEQGMAAIMVWIRNDTNGFIFKDYR